MPGVPGSAAGPEHCPRLTPPEQAGPLKGRQETTSRHMRPRPSGLRLQCPFLGEPAHPRRPGCCGSSTGAPWHVYPASCAHAPRCHGESLTGHDGVLRVGHRSEGRAEQAAFQAPGFSPEPCAPVPPAPRGACRSGLEAALGRGSSVSGFLNTTRACALATQRIQWKARRTTCKTPRPTALSPHPKARKRHTQIQQESNVHLHAEWEEPPEGPMSLRKALSQ